ncbi:hypothetical protein LEN26_018175 [Aphanomyces euteiches]|nr:hypothetical protein LEN26_018175 [Aphanomyces euteiches]KAH9112756.1 hypothetical protein AeMF1_012972 [Aphanomyces euteiches]KAH9188491.1 hypothetical protein AeNC1_009532 [Aphanomyces euteiches]
MASAAQVLASSDLVQALVGFQSGVLECDTPVTRLAHAAPRSIPHLRDFLVQDFQPIFDPWLRTHGYSGLKRIVSTTFIRPALLAYAASVGNLPLLQVLLRTPSLDPTTSSSVLMDIAATQGHDHIVAFLHAQPGQMATTAAMNGAAANGHLEIVQFLHAHRSEGCTTDAMDDAAGAGHLHVVQWLGHIGDARCTVRALDAAAARGHIRIVQFLLEEVGMYCSPTALFTAACAGHDAVVRVLWAQILDKEAARTAALRQASQAGFNHAARMLAATCM